MLVAIWILLKFYYVVWKTLYLGIFYLPLCQDIAMLFESVNYR